MQGVKLPYEAKKFLLQILERGTITQEDLQRVGEMSGITIGVTVVVNNEETKQQLEQILNNSRKA